MRKKQGKKNKLTRFAGSFHVVFQRASRAPFGRGRESPHSRAKNNEKETKVSVKLCSHGLELTHRLVHAHFSGGNRHTHTLFLSFFLKSATAKLHGARWSRVSRPEKRSIVPSRREPKTHRSSSGLGFALGHASRRLVFEHFLFVTANCSSPKRSPPTRSNLVSFPLPLSH